MLTDLWLEPPLAIARVGSSNRPCPNYFWSANDVYPSGTGKTTIEAEESLEIGPDGRVKACREPLQFKDDKKGMRPVCPFFELHGRWEVAGRAGSGPITRDILDELEIDQRSVTWTVRVANLKPFFYTRERADRIAAEVTIASSETGPHWLSGESPDWSTPRLVPLGERLPLGMVQVTAMTADFPQSRLRFTPPKGLVYGPRDFNERIAALVAAHPGSMWKPPNGVPLLSLDAEQLILDPEAAWPRFVDKSDNFATNPAAIFAHDDSKRSEDKFPSLGLVDDISDGIITCRCGTHTASARVVVAPPRYAIDRRPFLSIADGLTNRVRPNDVSDPAFVAERETSAEIADFFERVLETVDLINVDRLFGRASDLNRNHAANSGLHPDALSDKMGTPPLALTNSSVPVTEHARRRHRRLLSLEVLEDRLREDPLLIERMVRPPLAPEDYHDARMPLGMQGSDEHPLHVTTRQYNLLVHWARRLRSKTRDAG